MGEALENSVVAERVRQARAGDNPYLVTKMSSGWLVMADKQMLVGHLILLPDPVAGSINDLDETARCEFMADMVTAGDALLAVTDSFRINYEVLGNTDPALHAHIVPRYMSEPEEKRVLPVWFYGWDEAAVFSEGVHGKLRSDLKDWLG